MRSRDRLVLAGLATAIVVLALAPPVATLARRFVFVQGIQFMAFAACAPSLLVLGAPWGGVGGRRPSSGIFERWAGARARRREFVRGLAPLLLYVAVVAAWRTPPAVNALARHGALVFVEAVSLLLVGSIFWIEIVPSLPFAPRLSAPQRIALAAMAMWAIWILAYLVGMSHASWYSAYRHVAGKGLSLSADQEIMTGSLWALGLFCYTPVIFANLFAWLRSEEDPDAELARLVREERRRTGPGGAGPEASATG